MESPGWHNETICLQDGDHVTFSEIKGMVELNECAPIKITVKSQLSID